MNKPIFIISAGGHAKVLSEALRDTLIAGFIETDNTKVGTQLLGIDIISQDFFLEKYNPSDVLLVNGLGSICEPLLRKKVFLFFKEKNYQFLSVIHPAAYVAKEVKMGEGVQVLAGSIVQIGSQLGDNVVVNTCAVVDHDCIVGRHSHIAPRATLGGGVLIEEDCHIGSAATVLQEVKIDSGCLVAAGAVVISHVNKSTRVAGVPAKIM